MVKLVPEAKQCCTWLVLGWETAWGIPGAARLWVVQEKESSEVFSFAVRKYEWGKQVGSLVVRSLAL